MKKYLLKKIRLKKGISQSRLAKILGVSVPAVSCYDRNERIPKKKTAYKYIDIAKSVGLKVNLEDIYPR